MKETLLIDYLHNLNLTLVLVNHRSVGIVGYQTLCPNLISFYLVNRLVGQTEPLDFLQRLMRCDLRNYLNSSEKISMDSFK